MNIFSVLVFIIFLGLLFKTFHLLSLFISLEMMSLLILMSFSSVYLFTGLDLFVLLLFLCVLACESALGLLLFVLFSRFFSKDYSLGLAVMSY